MTARLARWRSPARLQGAPGRPGLAGWAWMWASGIRAGPLVFALLGPILGVAAVAGSTYVLNLAVGVPIRASTALGIATALAASGFAVAIVRRLDLVEALPA